MTTYHLVEANIGGKPKYTLLQSGTLTSIKGRLKEEGFTFHYLNTKAILYTGKDTYRGIVPDKQLDAYIKNKTITRLPLLVAMLHDVLNDDDHPVSVPFIPILPEDKYAHMDTNITTIYEHFKTLSKAYSVYLDEEPIGWQLRKENLAEIYEEALRSYEGELLLETILAQVWVAKLKAKANKEEQEAKARIAPRKKPWWKRK